MSGAVLNTQGFGNRPENVEIPFVSNRSPSSQDINYPIGKRWVNPQVPGEYVLTSQNSYFTSISSVWSLLSAGANYIAAAAISPPMVNGTVVVTNPACLSTSSVFISRAAFGGFGYAYVENITNGSFTITGGQSGENSTFYYMIIN
jgi:hypothetical protein